MKKKTDCAVCGKEAKCQEYKGEYVCDSCYDGLKALEGLGNMFGQ